MQCYRLQSYFFNWQWHLFEHCFKVDAVKSVWQFWLCSYSWHARIHIQRKDGSVALVAKSVKCGRQARSNNWQDREILSILIAEKEFFLLLVFGASLAIFCYRHNVRSMRRAFLNNGLLNAVSARELKITPFSCLCQKSQNMEMGWDPPFSPISINTWLVGNIFLLHLWSFSQEPSQQAITRPIISVNVKAPAHCTIKIKGLS